MDQYTVLLKGTTDLVQRPRIQLIPSHNNTTFLLFRSSTFPVAPYHKEVPPFVTCTVPVCSKLGMTRVRIFRLGLVGRTHQEIDSRTLPDERGRAECSASEPAR
jgi:hypothetical protein